MWHDRNLPMFALMFFLIVLWKGKAKSVESCN
uniref:Uncharacterized protein n=1 Tax=Arundo donax TaxID=35708 RepID=A0A0A9AD49_ARUDO